jgi:hypothetical protein
MLLARQVQPASLGTGGNDKGVGMIFGAVVALEKERPPRQIHAADMVPNHLRADMLGLGLHFLHQPGPLDDAAESGIIFDVGGGGQLTARLNALDDDRREAGTGRINGRSHPRRAGTEN